VAGTTVALIDRKLRCDPEPPRERAPGRGIPAALDRVIMRSLARFSAHRYKSATEMRMALEAALSAPERQRSTRRRVATAALLGFGMLLGATIVKNAARPEVRARAFAVIGPVIVRMGLSPSAPRKAQTAQKGEDEPVAILYDAPKPAEPAASAEDSDEVADPSSGDTESTSDTNTKATSPESSPEDGAELATELAKAERYMSKEKFVQALNVYRNVAKKSPEDARVLRGWADAAIKTKGWGEALRVAINWASQDSSPEAQLYLAHVQQAAGQRYGAVATLTRVLSDHPDNREAREMLSRISDSKLAAR
jgi:hypothetical protein